MMFFKHTGLVLFVLFGTVLFANAQAVLEGQLLRHPDWQPVVYLVEPRKFEQIGSDYEGKIADTLAIDDNGRFYAEFHHLPPEGRLITLFVQPTGQRFGNGIQFPPYRENYLHLVLFPDSRLRLEGRQEELAVSTRLTSQSVDHINAQLEAIRECRRPFLLQSREEAKSETPDDATEYQMPHDAPATVALHHCLLRLADTTTAAIPALVAARYYNPDNEYRSHPEHFVRLCRRLQRTHPGDAWVEQFCARCDAANLPVLEGEKMPDFALPTPAGDTLRLSDVQGRLILIDFWASWCAPCRKEAREVLAPLYAKYREKGFEIVGISIDRNRDAWLKAIQKDGAVWLQASDLLGDETPIRQSLRFQYIPASYLLDGNQVLLARNLHGAALLEAVEAYFSK